jgi:hypothetical protein
MVNTEGLSTIEVRQMALEAALVFVGEKDVTSQEVVRIAQEFYLFLIDKNSTEAKLINLNGKKES